MKTEIKYRGKTTVVSDILLEPVVVYKNKPVKTDKFGSPSLYYDGKYYFYDNIKASDKREGLDYEIQVVFYDGKWKQDTFYIAKEFKEFLLNHI